MYYPLPSDFVSRINKQFGEESQKFINSLDQPHVNSVRINPWKRIPDLFLSKQIPWCENGYYLDERPQYTLDPLFHSGSYYPQESSSMFLCYVLKQILRSSKDYVVLDLCGAPGGKSTILSSFLNHKGLLVTNEVIRSRAMVLKENMIKWGSFNTIVTQNDPRDFNNIKSVFDIILVDAPCSGEGMFRKDHSSRLEWSIENTQICSLRQRRILSDVWDSLKEGGFLIYSTCTFNPSENEENMEWLLSNRDCKIVDFDIPDKWPVETLKIRGGHGFAFYPHKGMGEGFFLAVIQKLSTGSQVKEEKLKFNLSKSNVPAGLLKDVESFNVLEQNNLVYAISKNNLYLTRLILNKLNVIYHSLEVGKNIKGMLNPSHSLAMNVQLGDYYPTVNLTLSQSLKYLKGETDLNLDVSKGWYVVTFLDQSLGFIKSLGNRINNYYPKEYRIRMNLNF